MGFDRHDPVSSGGGDNNQNEEKVKKYAYLVQDMGMSPETVYSRTPKELDELIQGSQILEQEKQDQMED